MVKSNIYHSHHRLMRTWVQMRILETLSMLSDEKIAKIMDNVKKRQKISSGKVNYRN